MPPTTVEGTSAAEVFPAVRRRLPSCFQWPDPAGLDCMAKSMNITVFQPMGDRASSNIAIFKHWGLVWESSILGLTDGAVHYLPDTCQAHSHHRAKSHMRDLKRHLGRHYSMANMYRLPDVQSQLLIYIEGFVKAGFRRDFHEAPPQSSNLNRAFFDCLFHLSASHHSRKGGSSALVQDIELYLSMANGDPTDGMLTHYSRQGDGNTLCCSSFADSQEKYLRAVVNVLIGTPDKVPTESRWTNMGPAFKKTLVRKFVHDIGLHTVRTSTSMQQDLVNIDDDVLASAEYFKRINGVRSKRAVEYLTDGKNIAELAVLCILLDTMDQLLFALLGGVDRLDPPCKLDALLDKESSLIGKVQADLAAMLDGALCVKCFVVA